MPAFTFKVVVEEEGLKEGTVYAPSLTVARNSLIAKYKKILSVEPVSKAPKGRVTYVPALFTRQLATLINSGIAINRAVELLAEQGATLDMEVALLDIGLAIASGSSFSEALEAHPRFFSPLYIAMCRVGETRGNLPTVLLGLADHQEMEEALRRRLTAAMTYPAVVLAITAIVTIFLFNFVLPYFIDVFDAMNVALPFYSAILVSMVRVANNPVTVCFLAFIIGAAVWHIRCWLETAEGRRTLDSLKLRTPVVGPMTRKVIVTRFAKTMSTLLNGGIFTHVAFDLCASVVQNAVYQKALWRGDAFIRAGKGTIADFLRTEGELFPRSFIEFVAAGEESGELTEMLDRAAELYDVEVDCAVRTFVAALEPVMVMITGCIVAFIVLAVFLPLYTYMGTLT